jgi:hypothetical protein
MGVGYLRAEADINETYKRATEITDNIFSIMRVSKTDGQASGGIRIVIDTDGSPALELSDSNGSFALLNRAFFTNTQGVSNTWTSITLARLCALNETVEWTHVRFIATGDVSYIFNEGYAMVGNTIQYNVSRSNTPSTYNGSYHTSNSALDYNRNYLATGYYAEPNNGQIPYTISANGARRIYTVQVIKIEANGKGTRMTMTFERPNQDESITPNT